MPKYLAGIDEAGRGPLAGPVVAAAVILPKGLRIAGLKDSKKLNPSQREKLFLVIQKESLAIGLGIIGEKEIDQKNILEATKQAMVRAVKKLKIAPDLLFIDGNTEIKIDIKQKTIIKGDALIPMISAASVIAKVTRDRIMTELHQTYPQYNFHVHKGYGTQEHLSLIRKFGPCEIHRKTFRGVKEYV